MHELGVMMQIIEQVESIALENQAVKVQTLVLQIGELSSMIPQYIEACFPAAAEGTLLQDTELVIEILPGNGLCQSCEKVYNLVSHKRVCPHCGSGEFEILSGQEFNIKEIMIC